MGMRVVVSLPGFEPGSVVVESNAWSGSPRLLQDGQPVARDPRTGEYVLRRPNGKTVVARLRQRAGGLDPLPTLEVDGQDVHIGRPLAIYEWVWVGLPLLLIVVGGGIGAAVGVVAAWLNAGIFRSDRTTATKFALTGVVSLAAVGVYFLAAMLVGALFGQGS